MSCLGGCCCLQRMVSANFHRSNRMRELSQIWSTGNLHKMLRKHKNVSSSLVVDSKLKFAPSGLTCVLIANLR